MHTTSKPKVGDLNVRIIVFRGKQKVLRLQIAMGNSRLMHALGGLQQYFGKLSCVFFGVLRLFQDAIEDVSTTHVVHHHVEVLFFFVEIQKLNDVLTVRGKGLHDRNFVHDELVLAGSKLSSANDLYSVNSLRSFVYTFVHSRAGSLANLSPDFVFIVKANLSRRPKCFFHHVIVDCQFSGLARECDSLRVPKSGADSELDCIHGSLEGHSAVELLKR
mmetsp:Transcript_17257/g.49900  ORF Transcript_17257/g.49900 Transcript_17257/m.49900 type:complete len:218 (-) Transcript_17257:1038-1691(-)